MIHNLGFAPFSRAGHCGLLSARRARGVLAECSGHGRRRERFQGPGSGPGGRLPARGPNAVYLTKSRVFLAEHPAFRQVNGKNAGKNAASGSRKPSVDNCEPPAIKRARATPCTCRALTNALPREQRIRGSPLHAQGTLLTGDESSGSPGPIPARAGHSE